MTWSHCLALVVFSRSSLECQSSFSGKYLSELGELGVTRGADAVEKFLVGFLTSGDEGSLVEEDDDLELVQFGHGVDVGG